MILVILVVFVFLRNARTTFIPSVAVPVSLIGTFGVMYLLGYSLDNLSLMALCISTGFVVDDAIVVIENITRYLEKGMAPFQAALKGAQGNRLYGADHQHFAGGGVHSPAADGRDCGPAVSRVRRDPVGGHRRFHGGLAHRHAHPCARTCLKQHESHGWMYRTSERAFNWVVKFYGRTLSTVLRFPAITLAVLLATIALNVYLYIHVPKGFFPAAGQRTHDGRDSG